MIARSIYKYLLFTALTLTACSDEISYDLPKTISIAHLKSQLKSNSAAITENYVVQGCVVANDQHGECYKSIIISDGSGGVEVAIDARELYIHFPLYSYISLHCSTLWMGDYGGRVLLGERPTGSYPVDYIEEGKIGLYIKRNTTEHPEYIPTEITLSQIAPQHIGNCFVIRDVTFGEQSGLEWCERDELTNKHIDTERMVYDREGNSLPIRVSRHCSYAAATIPDGWGSMIVIVQYFNGEYSLMIANYQLSF